MFALRVLALVVGAAVISMGFAIKYRHRESEVTPLIFLGAGVIIMAAALDGLDQ